MLSEKEKKYYLEQFETMLNDISNNMDKREFFIVDIDRTQNTWTSLMCMDFHKDIEHTLNKIVEQTYKIAVGNNFDQEKLNENNEEVIFDNFKKNIN